MIFSTTLNSANILVEMIYHSGMLAAGLAIGKIVMWQHKPNQLMVGADGWAQLPTIDLYDSFIQIQWNETLPLLAANNISDVIILNEQPVLSTIDERVFISLSLCSLI